MPEQINMPDHITRKLLDEIKQLEYELTTELPAEIKRAVALGDLSENAEYHSAKQRQEFVNARLGQLKKCMGELAMVNLANIPHDKVGFGSTIRVFGLHQSRKSSPISSSPAKSPTSPTASSPPPRPSATRSSIKR